MGMLMSLVKQLVNGGGWAKKRMQQTELKGVLSENIKINISEEKKRENIQGTAVASFFFFWPVELWWLFNNEILSCPTSKYHNISNKIKLTQRFPFSRKKSFIN